MTVEEAFQLALRHHQAEQWAQAETLYRQVLAAQPNHAPAFHCLGFMASQKGRHDLAVQMLGRSVWLQPGNAVAHCQLGESLRQWGRFADAIASFQRALQIQPDYAEAHNGLANALRDAGDLNGAIASYRRLIELYPDCSEGHSNLANALREKGQLEESASACRRALELKPGLSDAWNNLGLAIQDQGRLDEALAAFRRALALKPNNAQAHGNLGDALRRQGRLDEAVAALARAIELAPGIAGFHNNLGNVFRYQGRQAEAIAAYQRALELQPSYAEAHSNRGNALLDCHLLDEAGRAIARAIELKPDVAGFHSNLGNVFREQGQVDEAIRSYRQALHLAPERLDLQSNLIYCLHFQPGQNEAALSAARQDWNRQAAARLAPAIPVHQNDRSPDRRLRVGYVSPDFREHVVGRNLWPLIKHHQDEDYEILCYSGAIRTDRLTNEFRRRAAVWRDIPGCDDETLAEIIREDRVDILVDLSQHLSGNRLPLFTRRPAPVQVSFAGYPESTGVEAIEYRISDRWLEGDFRFFPQCGTDCQLGDISARTGATEPTAWLPYLDQGHERVYLLDSFWCYDPCGMDVPVNDVPALSTGHTTFGSLNNFCKINEPLLALWARVLGEVANSRLIILAAQGSHRQRTLGFLERAGVAPARVEFVTPCPRAEYLALYHRLDMVLDTFPYNGHTTSLDALWMGVPVVSLAGARAVSRAGLSQLSNLALPELVAHSEDENVRLAVQLAGDLPRLADLRRTLRARMESSVLMDAPGFARQIEAVYRAIWRRWCGG